jgi:hypothetical protein
MDILIYVPKVTPRINYTFRQVCKRILGLNINFTTKIETFIGHKGIKFSYANQRLGNEVYIQSFGLLEEQGVNDVEITVSEWNGQPYFFKTSPQSDIPFDIFAASFYLMTRYEEYLPHVKNSNGDFPASESLAYKNDFLTKPIINIWMLKFIDVLKNKFDDFSPNIPEKQLQANIAVKKAFKYRKLGISRSFVGFTSDVLRLKLKEVLTRIKTWFRPESDPYDVYDNLVDFKTRHGFGMDFMFQLGDYSLYTKNINFRKRIYKKLIKSMGDYCEIGLLPSYEATLDFEQLSKEIKRFEQIANHELKSIMIKDRGINFPEFYTHLDKTDILKDFSMGYYDKPGFRAGTSTPFLFYDLNLEQASPIEIRPYFLSSKAFKDTESSMLEKLIDDNKNVDIQYVLLFDNADFEDGTYKDRIFALIKKLSDVSK